MVRLFATQGGVVVPKKQDRFVNLRIIIPKQDGFSFGLFPVQALPFLHERDPCRSQLVQDDLPFFVMPRQFRFKRGQFRLSLRDDRPGLFLRLLDPSSGVLP